MLKLFTSENQYFFTKTDYVIESIRTAILLKYIPPGTRITEQEVKSLLKVSSSPIREAFNKLEAEGLLTKNPHVGTKVTEIDVNDAKELYSIQSLLQGAAVQISAKKLKEEDIDEAERLNNEMTKIVQGEINVDKLKLLNYKFHLMVCGINIYPWLTRLVSSLWLRLPSQTIWLVPNEPMVAIQYHKKIIAAIRKRNGMLAGSLMKKHFERSKKILFE